MAHRAGLIRARGNHVDQQRHIEVGLAPDKRRRKHRARSQSVSAVPAPSKTVVSTGVQSFALSFIAAFVDTCGFVGLFGLFTAHVTGNFVLIGAQLIHHEGDVLGKLLSLPVFMLAVTCAVLLAHRLKQRSGNVLATLLAVQAAWLGLTVLASYLLPPPASGGDTSAILIGMAAVFAMGVQNATMRIALPALPPTTVMTGNVTQVVIDAVGLLAGEGDEEARKGMRARLHKMWPGIAAFFLGAAGGALGYLFFGFRSLALPAIVCLALAMTSGTRD
ncbi:DUF1275 domain-containing protein [Oxalobacteraceae bacterium OM1]|nr:DUF1275 domain-containing protein [Oxalobacteraceae bacterium OM1]